MKLHSLLLALVAASSLSSCASDEPKRKKVVGPSDDGLSKLAWNRPRSWEGNARYGNMMPVSR
ncbi:MAG: hypothetical protein IPK32_04595 [Verrucomicrobiaceae bacterium]|nr:hypothetical protein [Verrucomicrobiaceae bacterium]